MDCLSACEDGPGGGGGGGQDVVYLYDEQRTLISTLGRRVEAETGIDRLAALGQDRVKTYSDPVFPSSRLVTPLQTELFFDQGYLHLQGFHPKGRMAPIRQQLLHELKRISGNARSWGALRTLPVFQQIAKLSASVNLPGLHETLMSAELFELVGRLAGRAPSNVQPTQLLLSPPQQGAWSLQGLNWHVDVRADAADPIPGIQAFFLLDDVAPRGGATLALAGSHRLGTQGMPSPASLRGVLGHSQNLVQDLQREGIALVEMSGRAGDVFLMDMRVMHTPSINSAKHPRMMATCRCLIG